jgi:hypothetical protein
MIVTYNGSGGGNPWNPSYNTPIVYSQCYYNGAKLTLKEGAYRDIRSMMSGMTSISSLKVPQGYEVDLYEKTGFGGRKVTVQSDNSCIVTALRGQVGSIVVRRFGGVPSPRKE